MASEIITTSATRRSNAERAMHTRLQVMEAVVAILNEKGFSALTNALIIERTGISSGALMHHFPTRQKLLIEVVGYAYEQLGAFRAEQFGRLERGLPRFRALIDMAWYTARMPVGFAVNEMRGCARSDEAIAAIFRPVFTQVAIDHGRATNRLVREAGLALDEEIQGLMISTSMAMRSLAIDSRTNSGPDIAEKALLSLRTLREHLIAKQLGDDARQDPRIAWTLVH